MDEALVATAGEYVLGTLSDDERDAFALRLAGDADAAAAVAMWRSRLAPLGEGREMAPPPALWPRIAAALGHAGNDDRVAPAWRAVAVAACLLAAALGGLLTRRAGPPPSIRPTYVAAVAQTGAKPVLLVVLDPASGRAVVRAVALTPPAARSLELWYIGGGRAPQSLGTIAGDARHVTTLDVAMRHHDRFAASTFAVTAEPVGGSPTGAPTGRILYSGTPTMIAPAS